MKSSGPYVSPVDRRVHRYFPDFIIKVKESTGQIKTYVIEVKPKRQTMEPKKKSRVTKSYIYECKTYAVNQASGKQQLSSAKTEELNLR